MSAWDHITPDQLRAVHGRYERYSGLDDFIADVLAPTMRVERIPLSRTDKVSLALAGLSLLGAAAALLWPR